MKTYVLYHANCIDGSGAALAAWLKLGDKNVEYIPVQYGDETPNMHLNSKIYILDFSYKRKLLESLSFRHKKIIVIDHHKTAQDDLSEPFTETELTCPVEVHFHKEKSGAVMSWEYFHQGKEVPLLLQLIQDRDLWKFDLVNTNVVTRALGMYPDWKTWVKNLYGTLDIASEGRVIEKFLNVEIEKIIKTPPRQFNPYEQDEIPLYNLQGFMISDTLHAALEKYPSSPYAVAYFDLPEKRVYSLRSRKADNIDVSKIAKKHGGGGHMHAAGFTVFQRN